MHIKHDKTADAMFIVLNDGEYARDVVVDDRIIIQMDAEDNAIRIELLNVSKYVTDPAKTTYEVSDTPVPRLDEIAKDVPAS